MLRNIYIIGMGALGVFYGHLIEKNLPAGEGNLHFIADADRIARYKEKTITVSFKDFSPAAIMAVIDSEEAPAPTAVTENTEEENPEVIADDNTEDTKDTEDSSSSKDSKSSSSSKSSAKSPKTGVADTWMLWFAASAVLAGAAAKKH